MTRAAAPVRACKPRRHMRHLNHDQETTDGERRFLRRGLPPIARAGRAIANSQRRSSPIVNDPSSLWDLTPSDSREHGRRSVLSSIAPHAVRQGPFLVVVR